MRNVLLGSGILICAILAVGAYVAIQMGCTLP